MQALSSALLFVDVKTAFAAVQRASVVSTNDGTEEWARFLMTCGFEADTAQRIIDQACRVAILVENGLCRLSGLDP